MAAHVGKVTRVKAGDVYVEVTDLARGYEFGPVLTTVTALVKGDRVIVVPMDRDPDELAVIGRLV